MSLETRYPMASYEYHGNCPNPECAKEFAIPHAAIAPDGSHQGFCPYCGTLSFGVVLYRL